MALALASADDLLQRGLLFRYCSGTARAGDVAGWMVTLSGCDEIQIRIDECVGGYEHRVERDVVHTAIKQLVKHGRCTGIFEQLRCGPWSAVKFSGGAGPQPIFRLGAVNGVRDKAGELLDGVAEAMASVTRGVELARIVLTDGKRFMSEHPASQGKTSLQPSPGLEDHTTMHQTSLFAALIAQFNLRSVFFDQGADGHEKRKTTELVCDTTLAPYMSEEVGTLRVAPGWVSATAPLRGKDETGAYRTKGAEAYPSPICKRFAQGWIRSTAPMRGAGAGGVEDTTAQNSQLSDSTAPPPIEQAPVDGNPFKIGMRVEVYWEKEKCWFAGTVVDTGVSKVNIKGKSVTSPDIAIRYDDGERLTHTLHNNLVREDACMPSLVCLMEDRAAEEQAALAAMTDDEGDATFNADAATLMATAEGEVEKARMAVPAATADLTSHAGEFMVITDIQLDIEDGTVVNKSSLFVVSSDGKLLQARSLDSAHARYWHTPTNEREFSMSPQRSLWTTAKELKWDKYIELNMFEWVKLSSIDQKIHRVYQTLWAYKIKFEEGLKFSKLNPRWCLKGGTMDRDKFKSHAETLRMSSYKIILACKGGYWDAFAEFLLDCSDAFQSTRTDGKASEEHWPLYCFPAPGFERRLPSGERMACKVNVAMRAESMQHVSSLLSSLPCWWKRLA